MIEITEPEIINQEIHFSINEYDDAYAWTLFTSSGTIDLNENGSIIIHDISSTECEIIIMKNKPDEHDELTVLVEMVE